MPTCRHLLYNLWQTYVKSFYILSLDWNCNLILVVQITEQVAKVAALNQEQLEFTTFLDGQLGSDPS
jgi:hypothetical protein